MAYTVADLRSAVQDDLKDSSFSAARILRYLNAGQRLILNNHALKFTEASVGPLALTVNDTTRAQQSDHQATIAFSLTDPSNTDAHWVFDAKNYLPNRDFYDRYPVPANNDAGVPQHWTEYGSSICFSCPLDKAYLFNQRYYKVCPELDEDTDVPIVPVEWREALELFVLWRSEKYRGNHDIAATYKQEFEEQVEALTLRTRPAAEVGFFQMPSSRARTGDA